MKRLWTIFGGLLGLLTSVKAQDTFQLAPPFLRYASVFFEKEATIPIQFAQSGTRIHYTTNGAEPTERDPVYKQPISIKKHMITLKARVFGDGFLPSETSEAIFFPSGIPFKSLRHSPPNAQYKGSGPNTLMDNKGGIANHSSTTWMGFQQDTVVIEIVFDKPREVRELLLHLLENQDTWIFLPQKVEVFLQKAKSATPLLITQTGSMSIREKAICHPLSIGLYGHRVDRLLIKIYPLARIPKGHPGEDKPAWLFLDEIKVY